MATQPADPNIFPVRGRLSYPHLFEPKAFKGGKPKHSCAVLMGKKKEAALIGAIQKRINELLSEPPLKGTKLPADKICLRDGALKDGTDGYGPDIMFISASSDKRPQVIDRDGTPLTMADPKPYAGCDVDGSIRLWVQNNEFGKRINAELRVIRFLGDNEPFGGGTPVDAESELPDVDTVEV